MCVYIYKHQFEQNDDTFWLANFSMAALIAQKRQRPRLNTVAFGCGEYVAVRWDDKKMSLACLRIFNVIVLIRNKYNDSERLGYI